LKRVPELVVISDLGFALEALSRAGGDRHFFIPAVQLTTTLIGDAPAAAIVELIRKRSPSEVTAY
jgi:hypothetical protein